MGLYSGTSKGLIVVNIDDRMSHYEGVAYLNEAQRSTPGAKASFTTRDKSAEFELTTDRIQPIDPATGLPTLWDSISSLYPDAGVSGSAKLKGSFRGDTLALSWTTDIGVTGSCALSKSKAGERSELVPLQFDWDAYKQHVAHLEHRRYLFRGQDAQWRLRTSFHRTGRAELGRFVAEDIQALHRHLSATTRHVFDLTNPSENGAFFNLVQHHGYPTPLLDWSFSPYVAAFFAYRGVTKERIAQNQSGAVRVLVFDHVQWRKDWSQSVLLDIASPHFSISEFIAIENERMIPQQAVSTVTNVDDIESYVKSKESPGTTYLQAIDLPISERGHVVRELSSMGITAGSLFPGLDGACEELKERNFDLYAWVP